VWLCFILLVCKILFTMGAAIQCFANLPNNIEMLYYYISIIG